MSNKRVLVDFLRLQQPYSGLGQVALNLGRELLRSPAENLSPVFLLPKSCEQLFSQPINYEFPAWPRRYLSFLSQDYDVWHILHQDASYLPNRRTPTVLTIHDLNFLEEKSPAKAKKRLAKVQRLVDRADVVTVISEFTRSVVLKHLELGNTPVEVVYNGLCKSECGSVESNSALASRIKGSFLFTIGVVREKKNFHVLIGLLAQLENINLVIAGNNSGGYADVIRLLAKEANVAHRVILTGEVSEGEKAWLFENCKAFVFPSLYEGFGLPLIEAMSAGKPVFSSSRTSLPEVGGEDVFYWDDFDPATLLRVYKDGLKIFADDTGRAERLKARAASFSWENAAREYEKIYQRLVDLS